MSLPTSPPYQNTPRHAITEWLPKTVENVSWCANEIARISPNDQTHLYAILISKTGTHCCIIRSKKRN